MTWRTTTGGLTGTSQWGEATNWTDSAGNVLSVAPTNEAERFAVTLPRHDYDVNVANSGLCKLIGTGSTTGSDGNVKIEPPAVNPTVESVEGPINYMIRHTILTTYKHQPKRVFEVANPNGFLGWWDVGDANAWFRLPATDDFVPSMNLSPENRPYVDVPTAGTTAEVPALRRGGVLDKMGAGTLRVGMTPDASVGYLVEEGTLELNGRKDRSLEEILATAALHLDASVESSLTYVDAPDRPDCAGRTFVDRWDDVRGNGLYAYFPNYAYAKDDSSKVYFFSYTIPPFVSPATSPTGLRLLDFGSRPADKGALGPSNCVLQVCREITGISDVFGVEWDPRSGVDVTLVGGREGTKIDYNRKGAYLWGPTQYQVDGGFKNPEIIYNSSFYTWDNTSLQVAYITNLFTFCLSSEPTGRMQLIGSDRFYTSRSGRTRTGEIILFTNSLTRAERLLVSRYLDEKWRTGDSKELDGYSAVVSAGASLSVPKDRTAQLAAVSVQDGSLVKTGEGTLAVDALSSAAAPLSVDQRAGVVRFGADVRPPTTDAPAKDAFIWLDAAAPDAFVYDTGARVTTWKDCRADIDRVATAMDDQNRGNLPTVVPDAVGGKPVVSFGLSADSTQAYFALPGWEAGAGKLAYAGFMVVRPLVAGGASRNYFGSSDMTMMRNSSTTILSKSYRAADSLAARWAINGRPIDPMADQSAYTQQTNDFFVLAFMSSKPLVMNAISKDRFGSGQSAGCGNIAVGEFIAYHRPVSVEEFRDTEAYLMRKWLAKDHPALTPFALAKLTSGDAARTVVDAARDMTIDGLDSSARTLVKRGAGAVVISAVSTNDVANGLTVESGSLTTKIAAFDPDLTALFHFDVSDDSSLRYTVSDDGSVTNVTHLYDTRGNGIYARSEWDAQTVNATLELKGTSANSAFTVADPTLKTMTMADGKTGLALDFGAKRNTQDYYKYTQGTLNTLVTDSSAMRFYGADGKEYKPTTVKEVFLVAAQREATYNNLVGSSSTGAQSAEPGRSQPNGGNYMRSAAVLFAKSYCHPTLTNATGTVFVDGESVCGTSYSFTKDKGFRLLEFRPGVNTELNALALDRNCNAGGCYISEVIVFDRVLEDGEREYLRQHLRHKWFGRTAPVSAIGAVTVAKGASLDLGDKPLRVTSVAGGGTFSSGALTVAGADDAPAELAVTYRSFEDYDCIRPTAAVDFPNGVHVNVTFDFASLGELRAGEYVVFDPAGGLGLDSDGLTYEHNLTRRFDVSVFVRDGKIVLKLDKRGGVIILR